jgi:hypothetical protein
MLGGKMICSECKRPLQKILVKNWNGEKDIIAWTCFFIDCNNYAYGKQKG